MSGLPARPSLEHVRGQAKARQREREIALSQARHELAGEYGFGRWSKLVHAIQANQLHGIERALVLADRPALAAVLEADKASATAEIAGLRLCWCCCAARSARPPMSAIAPSFC
jgi:hypothetical protein